MDFETAAPAPVTETVSTAQVAEALTSTPETEAEPDYGAVYDKLTADSPVEAAEPAPEAVEAPEAAAPAPEAVEAPTDVPVALRKHWGALPEDARDAVLNSQREMSRKLSDMGRQVQGLEPIKSVLVGAVKELPALANMRPDEVAAEVVQLAKISADFKSRPLETFISLAQKHNMVDALRQALGGQPQQAQQSAALQTKIAALEQQLARAASPDFIREQVTAVTQQERLLSEVSVFAQGQEHWNAEIPGVVDEHGRQVTIQDTLAGYIAQAKKYMPGASAKDILSRAYETALTNHRPDLKAPVQAAVEAAATPDPERAKAAIQAKSINVTGRTTGKPREMTEEEIYSAAFDRASRK